ncbi:MAG: butyryl-CoA:acetate CoA-transferase [Campylobacter sp.]|uniref:butyryl-CoA:acetate CoA-transferase n=1 Tax=Campylobacter sp. TaxID=205 RepID=UPI002AA80ED4|nr:butyryl-CoA:acetate CoA-transferase [Campylobacter sp.]MCI7247739.1 butyryl-CoA:acetate CoA-transferase [Campylobacter sp.]
MDFEREYQQKLSTAEQAAKVIKCGDWVDYGWAVTTPEKIDAALAKRVGELDDVKLRGGVLNKIPAAIEADPTGEHISWHSWHCSGVERKLIEDGRGFYVPMRYSELPRYYHKVDCKPNVAIMQVAPMDKHGYFNLGPSASHLHTCAEVADVIIVEVNHNIPRCLGGSGADLHISMVDMIVEGDNPALFEPPLPKSSEIDLKVAQYIVNEIKSGSCLQLGIGAMPSAVGSAIAQSDLKDLGVHTEIYVDSFVEIAEAGKITGKYKNLNKFRQTYAFAMGSKKLYDFLDNNPGCLSASVDYTNDIANIAAQDNFVSINSAVDIDLFGQVNSESSGKRHISGAGGQLDFVMGAYLSKGGKSFICCSSTVKDKNGEVRSRFLPTLKEGSIVTATRANIHYLVTEYGIVNLKGLSTWAKCEKIISVAHPDFRDELIRGAEELKIWRRSNKLK